MKISRNKVITFHYRLTDADGDVSESTHDGEPVSCLHGHGGLVAGLEEALNEREAGDAFDVTVPPDQGYGKVNPQAVQRVPIKRLVRPGKLAVGKTVVVDGKNGRHSGTVTKVGHFNVDLDLNHPLAGKTLTFAIQIVDVREATSEEIAHGHVHGPGGAHH